MINYDNYNLTRLYLEHLTQLRRLHESSVGRYRSHLSHLLVWADETPLGELAKKLPTFEQYLETARRDDKKSSLARETVERIVATSQRFLLWAKAAYPREMRGLDLAWINAMRPPRVEDRVAAHEFVTVEEVKQLIALPNCHSSGYTVPAVVTHSTPPIVSHTRPGVVTHSTPPVVSHTEPVGELSLLRHSGTLLTQESEEYPHEEETETIHDGCANFVRPRAQQ